MKKAILISCFEEWYRDRLKPIEDYLINSGYEVKCILSDFNHIGKKYSRKENSCDYIHVPKYESNISIQRIRSHLFFGRSISQVLKDNHPDLIYLIVPPNNSAIRCSKYKKAYPKTTFILDIIDLWPESIPLGRLKHTLPANIWRNWRNDAIRVADHVFTECDLYKEMLKGVLIPEKTSTLYLFKEQTEEEQVLVQGILSRGKTDNVIRFAYLGSMNNIIDIEGICEVITQFIEVGKSCELRAIGDGESREDFEGAVRRTGCQAHFYGLVFDELEKIKILAPCDYAFNMMKDTSAVGLTIKSIDYLSYGLPLINNIKGDTWILINKKKIGNNIVKHNRINVDEFSLLNHRRVRDIYIECFSKNSFLNTFLQAVADSERILFKECEYTTQGGK